MPSKVSKKNLKLPGEPRTRRRNKGGPDKPREEGGKTRTEGELERDLLFITDLYIKGKTLFYIQQELNKKYYKNNPLSRTSISGDIDLIKARWKAKYTNEIQHLKLEELGKIDKVEAEYWNEWIRLKDPRYMQGVHWCVGKRCELLGLNAPIETNNNVKVMATQIYLPDNGRGDGPSV